MGHVQRQRWHKLSHRDRFKPAQGTLPPAAQYACHAYRTCARPRGTLERFDDELGYIGFACCGTEPALSAVQVSRERKARRGREQGMAAQSSSKSIDVQKVISGAAELEVKALLAGVEYLQVWISQAGKLASIAGDTLQAIKNDKGSLSDTARRLTDFGNRMRKCSRTCRAR